MPNWREASILPSSMLPDGCQPLRRPGQSISALHPGITMAFLCSTHVFSDYNIVDATPFKRDILKELADECHKQGIRLHLYYSHIDWYREDAPWGRTGRGTGRPNPKGDWNSYYKFMNNQLTELLTNYGKIGAIWFDGWWDQDQNPDFDWQLPGQYAMIHRLQPACLVGNNHHQVPFVGEDIQIFERDCRERTVPVFPGRISAPCPLKPARR